ncbi:MAG: FkbM family methyltransferase [Dolichospermum sp.]
MVNLKKLTQFISQKLVYFGNRLRNLGYLVANPSYRQVRNGRGCADIYQLLNKKWFPKTDIKLVIDVGANEGQFIKTALALMPNTKILAFEPNPVSVEKLKEATWDTIQVQIFTLALGSCQDCLPLNVAEFSPASSLLKNSKQLNQEFPNLLTEKVIKVEINRLDSIIQQLNMELSDKSFLLKIDVQGFELEVLKGTTELFNKIAVIVCEVNLAFLYEQQCSINEIIGFLYQNHFRLVDIGQPIRSRYNEEILYVDLAFIHI